MQKSNSVNRPTTMFFLSLKPGMRPRLIEGVITKKGDLGPAIVLPEIPGVRFIKSVIRLDKHKPAIVKNGKVYNAIFKPYGGELKFSDESTIFTLVEPEADDKRLFIVAPKRWDFSNKLGADGIQVEVNTGRPNGSLAPGLMILNPGNTETPGDSVKFTHGGKSYILANANGCWNLLDFKPTPVVKVKPIAPEVVIDNRIKIETEGLKVVGKVELNSKKEVAKPTPAKTETKSATITPVVKKEKPKQRFKKGFGNNGNHHVALEEGQTLPDYVPASTNLGALVANALKAVEQKAKPKKVAKAAGEKKVAAKKTTTKKVARKTAVIV